MGAASHAAAAFHTYATPAPLPCWLCRCAIDDVAAAITLRCHDDFSLRRLIRCDFHFITRERHDLMPRATPLRFTLRAADYDMMPSPPLLSSSPPPCYAALLPQRRCRRRRHYLRRYGDRRRRRDKRGISIHAACYDYLFSPPRHAASAMPLIASMQIFLYFSRFSPSGHASRH